MENAEHEAFCEYMAELDRLAKLRARAERLEREAAAHRAEADRYAWEAREALTTWKVQVGA